MGEDKPSCANCFHRGESFMDVWFHPEFEASQFGYCTPPGNEGQMRITPDIYICPHWKDEGSPQ